MTPDLTPDPVDAFIAGLPKVDLHVHLLGAASVATVLELANRHPGCGVPTDPGALAEFYRFTGFAHFIEVYTAVNRLVTEPADVEALVVGLASQLEADNVRYAEVTVTPLSHHKTGIDPAELAQALDAGRRHAAGLGVALAWVFDISGDDGLAGGEQTLDWVLRQQPTDTVGFGLGGPEAAAPRAMFAPVFARARAAGLHSVPHAGETTGPEQVWSAVRDLGAERIGHGLGAAEDPFLLHQLGKHGIAVECCLTSNLRTGAIASADAHPLHRFVAAGVPVTIGSDDPGMFGSTLNQEYRRWHDAFDLSLDQLWTLAYQGVNAAFCPQPTRMALVAELGEHYPTARTPTARTPAARIPASADRCAGDTPQQPPSTEIP